MTKKQFLAINGKDMLELGRFSNEYGEEYIVFKFVALEASETFIVGDETNWDVYILNKNDNEIFAYKDFHFSDEEKEEIEKII